VTTRLRGLIALLALAVALGGSLAGCGKKGDLDPPENRPSTYPRSYQTH